jgi:translation initiation factor 1 (eIF-1/SUI1)
MRKLFGAVVLVASVLRLPATTLAFQSSPSAFARPTSRQTLLYSSANKEDSQPNKKKTKGFKINPNLVGSISSDGILTDRRKDQPARAATTSLGKPTKRKHPSAERIMSKKDRQRTANGAVDSRREALVASPQEEKVQVLEAKRGSKTVTIVRGMTSPMDERKKLLKEMKRAIGVGGTLVDGVLEIQGPHSDKVLSTLKNKGYVQAKKIPS